jgi:glucokinase
MGSPDSWVVVGLDNGGTSNNATVLDASGRFLVDRLVETPSSVQEGPDVAVEALVEALDQILEQTGTARTSVRVVGLDTPGPASADGVISSKGATNFAQPARHGFDVRGALEARLELPVVYSTTPTPPRCMPIMCASATRPRSTPRSRRSSGPG